MVYVSKEDVIGVINYAKYFAFIFATVFVIIFQFTSASVWVRYALLVYFIAFTLTFISLVFHACEVFSADRQAKKQNAQIAKPNEFMQGVVTVSEGELKGEKAEVVSVTSEKVWTVIGAIFSILFALFTFAVFILCF